jgi:hypothetical protein
MACKTKTLRDQGSFRGGTEIRTPDPLHAMQVLYQLSYTPKGSKILAVEFDC